MEPHGGLKRYVPVLVVTTIAGLGLVAAVVGAVVAKDADAGTYDPLWLEVAKAGIQVIAVGALGGALAWAWKGISERREAVRANKERDHEAELARLDQIRAQLFELFEMYNEVKQVRRIARSLGLDLKDKHRPPTAGPGEAPLTAEQAAGFRTQMLRLDSVQLKFESKARQFGQTHLLKEDTASVVEDIGVIESFLRDVLENAWEGRAWMVRAGTPVQEISDALQPLLRKDDFRPGVSKPLDRITSKINKSLFGSPSSSTDKALQAVTDNER